MVTRKDSNGKPKAIFSHRESPPITTRQGVNHANNRILAMSQNISAKEKMMKQPDKNRLPRHQG